MSKLIHPTVFAMNVRNNYALKSVLI